MRLEKESIFVFVEKEKEILESHDNKKIVK